MSSLSRLIVVLAALPLLSSCGTTQLFPAETLSGVDQNFDFSAWRSSPSTKIGTKVQLGGRILQADSSADGLRIVAFQLPIVDHPAYGPREVGKRNGEMVIRFSGKIPAKALAPENKLIVIGTTESPQSVSVDDVQRSLPSVNAQCVHIWLTGRQQISEFPHNIGGGYEPLEESTFCLSGH
ncbi:MAG: Slp family lipoprotein [Nitrospiraceae bacterium]|nr:Slp family lipoprotein [Nitrospiraceae bacterium]